MKQCSRKRLQEQVQNSEAPVVDLIFSRSVLAGLYDYSNILYYIAATGRSPVVEIQIYPVLDPVA